MPSNDTENIYATQYGGEGEPIPASKISYDNSDSGLSATKVQDAIDELASSVSGLDSAVEDLETALNQKYVLADSDVNIEVTADGTKTYSEVFDDLNTAFLAYLASLDDGDLFFLTRMQVSGVVTVAPLGKVSGYNNTDVSINPSFSRIEVDSGNIIISAIKFGSTKIFSRCGITTVPAVTVSDKLSDVPAATVKVVVSGHLYKQV